MMFPPSSVTVKRALVLVILALTSWTFIRSSHTLPVAELRGKKIVEATAMSSISNEGVHLRQDEKETVGDDHSISSPGVVWLMSFEGSVRVSSKQTLPRQHSFGLPVWMVYKPDNLCFVEAF
eukprot:scaffold5944_cov101-Amphora_coffeaeformis.AAC.1